MVPGADCRSWKRAALQARPPVGGWLRYTRAAFPQLIPTPGGLVGYDSANTSFWFSQSARVWRRPRVGAAPPANLAPQGVCVVGDMLIAVEPAMRAGQGPPDGATTFWRLSLSR